MFCCASNKTNDTVADNTVADSTKWDDTLVFIPQVKRGRVIKVYDGDTITIATKLPLTGVDKDTIWRFSVRLNGIDCPELRTKNESEKKIATIARDKLSKLILNKMVDLEDVSLEKYGRLLATVGYNGQNLNKWMVDQRLAVVYDGGTKNCPDNWEIYYNV